MAEQIADPEFMALPQRIRDRIDRTFDRALRRFGGTIDGPRKRRKLNTSKQEVGGGFIEEDQGGFVPDDEEGGFMPEDEAGGFVDEDPGGGFVDDDEEQPSTPSTKVPLNHIPALLAYLNLPSDEDVLGVFRASASGWEDDDDYSSRRRRAQADETEEERDAKLGVERKDFRAVCAALIEDDVAEEAGSDQDERGDGDVDMGGDDVQLGEGRRRQRPQRTTYSSEGSNDDGGFLPSDSEHSSLSSLSSDSEYGASRKKTRAKSSTAITTPQSQSKSKGKAKGKAKATGTDTDNTATSTPKRTRKKKTDLIAEDGPIKLNSRQKEMVKALWQMLKPDQEQVKGKRAQNPNVLGRDEVKVWARQLGEMWTDEEVNHFVYWVG